VGAIIGYGVVNSLRLGRYPLKIVGLDIYAHAVGQYWCDAFERSLPVADPGYTPFLQEVIARHRIDLVIPGIEQDVTFLSRHRAAFADTGARLALNDAELIAVSDDKWLTREALLKLGLPAIDSVLGTFDEIAARLGAVLIKPRSYASKGIVYAGDAFDLAYWQRRLGDNFMAQRVVGDADSEFTASLFGWGDGGGSRKMVLQRWLAQDGSTARARVAAEPELEAQMDALTRAFRPVGPTNFQFRRERPSGRCFLLEVNPRLSSSTSLRRAFGMNEAEMCVAHYLDGERPTSPAPARAAPSATSRTGSRLDRARGRHPRQLAGAAGGAGRDRRDQMP
jgi:carbamoyl-phosphate synthase large subunit